MIAGIPSNILAHMCLGVVIGIFIFLSLFAICALLVTVCGALINLIETPKKIVLKKLFILIAVLIVATGIGYLSEYYMKKSNGTWGQE